MVTPSRPNQGALEEGGGVVLALRWQDLGIGEPGRIIDGDVQEVPAMPSIGVHARTARREAMADAIDLAQLLDVEMDHLARPFPFVADHRRLRFEPVQPVEAEPPQHQAHARAGHTQDPGNARSALALTPQMRDGCDLFGRQLMRAVVRR